MFVDKPAGLLSVPGRLPEHKDSLFNRLLAANPEIRLIHRLDMDTSGVMVFAKTADAQRNINRQFEIRSTQKIYLAEIIGHPVQNGGTVDFPLMPDWPNRPLQKVDPAGKPCRTHWRVLHRKPDTTIIELRPETGRSHQLRVHMAHIGHAIIGDRFYADPIIAERVSRLHLHALSLGLSLPDSGRQTTVTAPCPFVSQTAPT